MNILITNDDGIEAAGLRRLAEAASKLGEVWIVAPDTERSAAAHSLTIRTPVDLSEYPYRMERVRAYTCSGMPTDCVRIGITSLLPAPPDYVLAGINFGYNIASDIQYSATVAAALEAAFLGVPAIAVSQGTAADGSTAEAYLDRLLRECMARPLKRTQIWNINFPDGSLSDCRGVLWNRTVSTDRFYDDSYRMEALPSGRLRFHLAGKRVWCGSPGTDMEAIGNRYISVGIVNNIL